MSPLKCRYVRRRQGALLSRPCENESRPFPLSRGYLQLWVMIGFPEIDYIYIYIYICSLFIITNN